MQQEGRATTEQSATEPSVSRVVTDRVRQLLERQGGAIGHVTEQQSQTVGPGAEIKRYKLGKAIGEGGVGEVFEAIHFDLRKTRGGRDRRRCFCGSPLRGSCAGVSSAAAPQQGKGAAVAAGPEPMINTRFFSRSAHIATSRAVPKPNGRRPRLARL